MENFLPALLIIGGVIYKIYTEYKKEQEKVRRRMPQTPPPQHQEIFEERPRPPVVEPTMSIPMPAIPKEEYFRNMPEEARRAKAKRQTTAASVKRTAATPLVVDIEEEKGHTTSFNLREAVIQSAILNRPF